MAASNPNPQGLNFELSGQPDFSFLKVQLPAGRTLKVEASAMAGMDTHIQMKTRLRGGFKRMLSGESIFLNEFTADGKPGEICIAPGIVGDMGHVYLDQETVYLQNSAFVAADAAVQIETKWQGFIRGFFSGEGLFLIRCSGQGDLWFNTFGGVVPVTVQDELIVDTGYLVAFTDGLDYQLQSIGGLKSFLFSGEGLVARFRGQGTVWIQTRQVPTFSSWINPFRRVQKQSSGSGN